MYRLTIKQKARLQLKKEIEYSRRNWGAGHAKKYREELTREIYALQDSPKIYQLRPELGSSTRLKRYKGNQIIYKFNEEKGLVTVFGIYGKSRNITPEEIAENTKSP